MINGDFVLFNHSKEGLEIIGIAKVIKEAYQDSTTNDQRWVVVDLELVETLIKLIPLDEIKKDKGLKNSRSSNKAASLLCLLQKRNLRLL